MLLTILLWNKESDTEDVKKNDRRIPKGERKYDWPRCIRSDI